MRNSINAGFPGCHDEVILQPALTAVEIQINPGIETAVTYARVIGNSGVPLDRITTEIIVTLRFEWIDADYLGSARHVDKLDLERSASVVGACRLDEIRPVSFGLRVLPGAITQVKGHASVCEIGNVA
jgi:hypothetical protein